MELTRPRKLVLCFDGTGNKFRGDDSDSNILKIFRMLDRTAGDQYHYYQPGIGTYVVSKKLSHRSPKARLHSWYKKAKDSAIGTSFDEHVVGGYRFLMRFYNPGDEIYMFGFSRGAYIARFLAEMLDYVGLLSHGNEEMVQFAWKAFSQWQCRRHDHDGGSAGSGTGSGTQRKHEMYAFLKNFRETFSRPVCRIRFLGLFDTVNSVPQFETAWMARSKFPYTARTSARVIRHAVALDERRARFRQDLVYQSTPERRPKPKPKHKPAARPLRRVTSLLTPRRTWASANEKQPAEVSATDAASYIDSATATAIATATAAATATTNGSATVAPTPMAARGRRASRLSAVMPERNAAFADAAAAAAAANAGNEDPTPYRARSRSRSRETGGATATRRQRRLSCASIQTEAPAAGENANGDAASALSEDNDDVDDDDDDTKQDLLEAWFAGGHGDTGGGWPITPGTKSASHVPLAWMVREAMRAGLAFDAERVVAMGCSDVLENQAAPNLLGEEPAVVGAPPPPVLQVNSRDVTDSAGASTEDDAVDDDAVADGAAADNDLSPRAKFHAMLHRAHLAPLHDSLAFGGGLSAGAVLVWNAMEYLPFRRMDLRADGSWQPIRWPLPHGEVRDVPATAVVHGSVLRRMRADPAYRPGNLIVGGGGRGCRVAPARYGMGEWECIAEEGDPIGELWRKKV